MSEHKIGEFIREHKKAELAASAGTVLAGTAIAAAYIQRRKRRHDLQTFSSDDLSERLTIFGFKDTQSADVNVATQVAGKLYSTTSDGTYGGLSTEALLANFSNEGQSEVLASLQRLECSGFVELADLPTGQGYRATPDLARAFSEGESAALGQYLYNYGA